MKLDGIYNPFASGERTTPSVPSKPVRQPLPPVQQQPERPYPWVVMRMQ